MRRAVVMMCAVVVAVAVPVASAAGPVLSIHPKQVKFGTQPYESLTVKSFTVTNSSSQTLVATTELVRFPDDFSYLIDSTCGLGDITLAPRESCTVVVGFRPTPFFAGLEEALIRVTARDSAGTVLFDRTVSLTGRGI
jgi:hypothetical protein